jgi:hypothetical protein
MQQDHECCRLQWRMVTTIASWGPQKPQVIQQHRAGGPSVVATVAVRDGKVDASHST